MGAKEGKADHTPQILVYDVNGDKLPDVVTSSAHGYGIFWYEQTRENGAVTWKQHVIDDTWTQAHSLALADINGDGTPDRSIRLVTLVEISVWAANRSRQRGSPPQFLGVCRPDYF